MIDFWEAVGRMACDEKMLQDFLALEPKPHTIAKEQNAIGNKDLRIPGVDYIKIQDFFRDKTSQPCLSLMAAGELRLAASRESARAPLAKLPPIMAAAQPYITNPSAGYFIGLGIIISDILLRDYLVGKDDDPWRKEKWSEKDLPRMSKDEFKQLMNLCRDQEFLKVAQEIHASCWDEGCEVRLCFWDGHLHPQAVDEYGKSGKPPGANKAVKAAAAMA